MTATVIFICTVIAVIVAYSVGYYEGRRVNGHGTG